MAGGGQEAWVAPSVYPDWFGEKRNLSCFPLIRF